MPFIISDMPLTLTDNTTQEQIDDRRAERKAREKVKENAKNKVETSRSHWRIKKAMDSEKQWFPNLTGDFDEESPFAKHFSGKRDQ